MVTSDRVSAFDHVLGTIPFKGQILTGIANFWFDKTKNIAIASSSGIAAGAAGIGATTTAVSAFGTASTGTAISALSGSAATSATLAAVGGGSIATGGGGSWAYKRHHW